MSMRANRAVGLSGVLGLGSTPSKCRWWAAAKPAALLRIASDIPGFKINAASRRRCAKRHHPINHPQRVPAQVLKLLANECALKRGVIHHQNPSLDGR
jgi:hypothetical protein